MRKGLTLSWLHSDHLGSASMATDTSGNTVANSAQRFTPFGSPRLNASGLDSKFTFTGQRSFIEEVVVHGLRGQAILAISSGQCRQHFFKRGRRLSIFELCQATIDFGCSLVKLARHVDCAKRRRNLLHLTHKPPGLSRDALTRGPACAAKSAPSWAHCLNNSSRTPNCWDAPSVAHNKRRCSFGVGGVAHFEG